MVRAIDRAEQRIRADPGFAVEALLREFPNLERRKLETIVGLYAQAIPSSPAVSAGGLAQALTLYPAARPAPPLADVDLSAYVDAHFADEAVSARRAGWGVWPLTAAGGALALVSIGLLAVVFRRRRARQR